MDPSSSDRNPVEELADEFLERHRNGEAPTVEEYCDKFPDFAGQIRKLFPTLLMMEDFGEDFTPNPEIAKVKFK